MNSPLRNLLTALAVALLLAAAALAQIPQLTPFSADMQYSSTRGHAPEMNGKMYVTASHMRMDMAAEGHESIMITDMPAKTSYMLMPQQHMYMEFKAGAMPHRGPSMADIKPLDPSNPCSGQQDMTCKKVGVETVNGRTCDHWQMSHKDGEVSDVWIDQKLHFPIKSVSKDSTWQLTNIKEGEPSASLFQIPAGYQKMDLGGMMQRGAPPQE